MKRKRTVQIKNSLGEGSLRGDGCLVREVRERGKEVLAGEGRGGAGHKLKIIKVCIYLFGHGVNYSQVYFLFLSNACNKTNTVTYTRHKNTEIDIDI